MRLSPNFTLEELTRSASHPEIRNVPDMAQLRNLVILCARILQPLRDAIGRPVRITSGFRCPKLNKAVGGATTSRHLTGQAADIAVKSDAEGKALFDLLRKTNGPTSASGKEARPTQENDGFTCSGVKSREEGSLRNIGDN